jgi:hypothetical protein
MSVSLRAEEVESFDSEVRRFATEQERRISRSEAVSAAIAMWIEWRTLLRGRQQAFQRAVSHQVLRRGGFDVEPEEYGDLFPFDEPSLEDAVLLCDDPAYLFSVVGSARLREQGFIESRTTKRKAKRMTVKRLRADPNYERHLRELQEKRRKEAAVDAELSYAVFTPEARDKRDKLLLPALVKKREAQERERAKSVKAASKGRHLFR